MFCVRNCVRSSVCLYARDECLRARTRVKLLSNSENLRVNLFSSQSCQQPVTAFLTKSKGWFTRTMQAKAQEEVRVKRDDAITSLCLRRLGLTFSCTYAYACAYTHACIVRVNQPLLLVNMQQY